MSKNDFPTPMNPSEHYLNAILIRTDALCNMMSKFIEVYADKNGTPTEEVTVREQVLSKEVTTKSTKDKATATRAKRKVPVKKEIPKE